MLLYLCGGDVGVTKGHLHCENPPWMILIMNPAPLKVTFVISFFFFFNVANAEGCAHSSKCISFMGSLLQIPKALSSTNPTLARICLHLRHYSLGLHLSTSEMLMLVLVTSQDSKSSETESGDGRN